MIYDILVYDGKISWWFMVIIIYQLKMGQVATGTANNVMICLIIVITSDKRLQFAIENGP